MGETLQATVTFVSAMFGASRLEVVASCLGLVNVVLIVRRSVWNYPFGIAMVILYFFIFSGVGLYAEAALQVYFLVIQILGWVWWRRHLDRDGLAIVTRATMTELAACCALSLGGALALGWLLATRTDAALPYWDSAVAALSVVAQYLLARRRVESWMVWIVVDILAIGLYLTKGLYPTAMLYTVFLGLAVAGLWRWQSERLVPRAAQ